jgi:tRNA modification GTPase
LVVAIAGPPNAGKSTLLNRIARREAAIVSPYAGTTRDVIEVHLDLSGLPVTLLDTAGIRETDDPVEFEGVRRARERAAAADLVLWVVDARDGTAGRQAEPVPLAGTTRAGCPIWVVHNKIDLLQTDKRRNEEVIHSNKSNESVCRSNESLTDMVNKRLTSTNEREFSPSELKFDISAVSGEGVDELLTDLSRHAETFLVGGESALITRERHRRALEDARDALRRALGPYTASREDLLAEELRIAAHALGRLTGRVDVEDVLDVIFRDFCIGK